jgi:hypothetical protein
MMLRPGLKYVLTTKNNNPAKYLAFTFSNSETALLEITDSSMRVIIDDVVVSRVAVSTVVLNPTFNANTNWTINDEPGAISEITSGLELTGTGYNKASRKQTITVAAGDSGKEHALNITLIVGQATIRVGSTNNGDEYINETVLLVGSHSLAFTPVTGNVFIEIFSRIDYQSEISSCQIASAGDMVLASVWTASDFDNIRTTQSGDVIFVACNGQRQKRIERHSARGWSVVNYKIENMPLRTINLSKTKLTLFNDHSGGAPSANSITASLPLFSVGNADSLFKLSIPKQYAAKILGGNNQWTEAIAISGVGAAQRTFTYEIAADTTAVGTLRCENSRDGITWHRVEIRTAAIAGTFTVVDASDNVVFYYRIGFGPTQYTSGWVTVRVEYENGITEVLFQATTFNSATILVGRVISGTGVAHGKTTTDWEEGVWSKRRGYPTAVALHQGRLWWAGGNSIYGSESDNFNSFDVNVLGNSGPIIRSIGHGPVDSIKWMASSSVLILGADISEYKVDSASGGLITATDFSIDKISTQGSKGVEGTLLDDSTVFVQRGGSRLYELKQKEGYPGLNIEDITLTIPEIGLPGITRIAIQRQPDTRIHCVRSDGTVALLVHDSAEDVRCWLNFETDGIVTDVINLPSLDGVNEDRVYYLVKRVIGGSDKYYLEKWALEINCHGGTQNHQADSHIIYSGSAITSITGLSHLEGESLVVWADGKDIVDANGDIKLHVVSAGAITLTVAASNVVAGLPYKAKFKTTKLAVSTDLGTPLNQVKLVDHLGLILYNTHFKGVTYGRDFDNQDDMPDTRSYSDQADGTMLAVYDEQAFEFSGSWATDSRVCLEANAPRPCTVLAMTLSMRQHDR